MNLSEFAIKKPITTMMVALSVMVLGLISLSRLPLEYLPNVDWPAMYITVEYPSSSPEEIDRRITRPLEETLATLPGIKSIGSSSYGTRCYVRVEFGVNTDFDMVAVQVRDRIDQARALLPDDVERIEIRRYSGDDRPILEYSMTWLGEDPDELARVYHNTLLPRLQRIQGVGSVEIDGLEEKVLLVDVNQNLLNSYNLDIRTINRALRNNNSNVSAGYVNDAERRLSVRTIGEFEEVDQIRKLPLTPTLDLKDVARVIYDFPEKTSFERLDGKDSVELEIRKSSTANLVETAALVIQEMKVIQEEIGPDKLHFHLIRDRSLSVTQGINNLTQSAIMGGILAVVAIFLFLRNFRSSIIIGSAIPISVLCVFMMMFMLRQFGGSTLTLNLYSMMGLMVAIGMLVDPAVVALENIFRKRYDEGQDAWQAALEGSKEIGMPVLAASLTTVCVFVPVIFFADSRNALYMKDFAITVVISVIASLCVALTLVPLAGSRAFRNDQSNLDWWLKSILAVVVLGILGRTIYTTGVKETIIWLVEGTTWFFGGLSSLSYGVWASLAAFLGLGGFLYFRYRHIGIKPLYARIVSSTLHFRWTTVTVACFFLGAGFYVYGQIEKRPYRYQSNRYVRFTVEMPRDYDEHKARALFEHVEGILIPRKDEFGIEAIGIRYSSRRSNRIYLYLAPPEESKYTTDEVKKKVFALLPKNLPGIRFKSGGSGWSTATGAGVELRGRNPQILAMLAEDVELRMRDIEDVHEIQTSLESGNEEIRVTVNRERAQRYGLSPQQVATTIASALGTRGGTKFKTPNGEIDITVQLQEEDRATLEQLKNSTFESERGEMVTFASLADFNLTRGRNAVRREDRMSTVTVFANTEANARYSVGQEMIRRMEEISLPAGYAWQMDRSFRYMTQEQGETNFTMIFAAILIYLIMASLFESYIHPFTIMSCISFAFVGVAFGFYTLGISIDSNAMYGLLVLFGIVVNNGIVLVDHINRYRRQGLFRRDAIIRGGQDRLRPIMMTATTTIIGLTPLVIPMIYGTADGYARRWGPIGLVVICGLSFSTLLTLILLPTVYSLMDDLSRYSKRVFATARS
ncbi:MAG: efflux RND transporter permease subunit [bacterium]|nr:efflux RND transporter permease subunit [bacterium]